MKTDYRTLHLVLNFDTYFQSHSKLDKPLRVNSSGPQSHVATNLKKTADLHARDWISGSGANDFRRELLLPRLIPVGPSDIDDRSIAGRARIVRRLAKALRGERARGRAGHWTYSLNRHIGLLKAFRVELAALRAHRQLIDKRSHAIGGDRPLQIAATTAEPS